MTQADFLNAIGQRLTAAGIPFMVVGSHASSLYGIYRATNDVDIVVDPTLEQLTHFLTSLGPAEVANAADGCNNTNRK
jgi:hypothetical protein